MRMLSHLCSSYTFSTQNQMKFLSVTQWQGNPDINWILTGKSFDQWPSINWTMTIYRGGHECQCTSICAWKNSVYLLGTKTSAFLGEKRVLFASYFMTIVVWFAWEYPHHRSKWAWWKKLMLVKIMIPIHLKHSHSIRFANNYLFGVAKANSEAINKCN